MTCYMVLHGAGQPSPDPFAPAVAGESPRSGPTPGVQLPTPTAPGVTVEINEG